MKKRLSVHYCSIAVFIILLAARPLPAVSAQDAPPPVPALQAVDSLDLGYRPVEVRLDPVFLDYQAAAPLPRLATSEQVAAAAMLVNTFTIEYVADGGGNVWEDLCTSFPDVAKPALEYAASIWASQLNPSVPIKIQACWSDMSTGVLGHSGTVKMYSNFANAPFANTWYPIALANQHAGTDLNGGEAEMSIAYNSDYLDTFYYGTDANTPSNQINFATVVLHEITHGLGFLGYMGYSALSGEGYWSSGMAGAFPMVYDHFTENGSGNLLINTDIYPNPSTQLGAELVSGNIYFNGANARAANDGTSARLYAPSTWKRGSSYAHLDYTTYLGTLNSLMTYAVTYGTTNYNPGPVAVGILTDVGWPSAPTAVTLSNDSVMFGQPVGTAVGAFSTIDPNSPETFTYALVAGGADNTSFTISGNTLRTNKVFPAAGSLSIRVRSTDRNGLYVEKNFTINVGVLSHAPINISLATASLAENQPANTLVGTLASVDPDAGSTFTYALVNTATCPGSDNAFFNISGNNLRTSYVLNYENKSTYAVCVRSTDPTALTIDKAFAITLTNVNEAPTQIQLNWSKVQVDAAAGTAVGTLVSDDPDAGDALTFTLPCDCFDNSLFTIDGNVLYLTQPVSRAIGETYELEVDVEDAGGLGVTQDLTIQVVSEYYTYLVVVHH